MAEHSVLLLISDALKNENNKIADKITAPVNQAFGNFHKRVVRIY